MKRLFIHQLSFYGSSYYRQYLPAKHVKVPDLEVTCSTELTHLTYDAYWFPLLFNTAFLPVIDALKREGKKIIWETDDNLWWIPCWNPAAPKYNYNAIQTVNWSARNADHVVVSTPPLKDAVVLNADISPSSRVTVLPNLIDLDDWQDLPPRDPGPVRILWAGSAHHENDLHEIVDAIGRIISEFGERVHVNFFGSWSPKITEMRRIKHTYLAADYPHSRYNGRLSLVRPVPLEHYTKAMCHLRPDIALAPLCEEVFNHSKSAIKWYECAMAGAAVVATDLPPYQQIRHGEDGFLVKTGDADGWYRHIKKLVEDRMLREAMAQEAKRRVINEFTWQNGTGKREWEQFFERIAR